MTEIKFFPENPDSPVYGDDDDEDSCIGPPQASTSVKVENNSPIPSKRHKSTRGKQKIPISFMQDRVRRCSTFSKRKTGLMKKAHELAELTGAEVLLLVASETNHVYTFNTNRFDPIIHSIQGRELIQSCLRPREKPPADKDSAVLSREAAENSPSPPTPPPPAPNKSPSALVTNQTPNKIPAATATNISFPMLDGTIFHMPMSFTNTHLPLSFFNPQLIDSTNSSPLCLTVSNGNSGSKEVPKHTPSVDKSSAL